MTPAALLEIAVACARAAGAVLHQKLSEDRTINFKDKDHMDLVTDADKAAEAAVLAILSAQVPDHGILAEESGASHLEKKFVWFVDPLDGTVNYAHRIPHYCTTLAVEETATHQLLAGVVFDPVRNELFTASRGNGAFLNGKPIRCSATSVMGQALLSTGFPTDVHLNPDVPLGLFNKIVQKVRGVRRMGSAALDLAYVASGRLDGYFEVGLKPWDVAAGSLLIEEAGGRMRRIDGGPFDDRPFNARTGDILGATDGIFDPVIAECSAFLNTLGWKPQS
jgi:myo-inositol-1(or 4)-monophosphatase